jgi:hypothetical protein
MLYKGINTRPFSLGIAVAIVVSAFSVAIVRAGDWKEIAVVPPDEPRFGPEHIYVSEVQHRSYQGAAAGRSSSICSSRQVGRTHWILPKFFGAKHKR